MIGTCGASVSGHLLGHPDRRGRRLAGHPVRLVRGQRLHPERGPPVQVEAGHEARRPPFGDQPGDHVGEPAHRVDRRAVRRGDRLGHPVVGAEVHARGIQQHQRRRCGHTRRACPNTLEGMTPGRHLDLFADRIRRAGEVAADLDVELLLITPGTDLRYLVGADGSTHERLTCLVLPAAGHRAPPALVVPRLEAPGLAHLALEDLGVEVITWQDGEDPYLLVSDLAGRPDPDRGGGLDARGARLRRPRRAARRRRRRWPVRCSASCGCARTAPRSTSCARPGRRSTACTRGWASSSRRAAPRRRSARTSPRRSSRRGTRSRRSSSSGRGPTGRARTTTCPSG